MMHYLTTQNSAGAGIYETKVIENPMNFNNSYCVPRFTWNNPSVPSVEFGSAPNIDSLSSAPPQYQSCKNSNNGFVSPGIWAQNTPAAPAAVNICDRPQQPSYPNSMVHTYGLPYVPLHKKQTAAIKKTKRVRTAFTTNQINALEQEYAGNKYLDTKRRFNLAATIQLNERAIKIWFQNRRMKEKKDRFEEAQEQLESVSTTTYPPGPGAPACQFSPYCEAFNDRIESASTSTATPLAEVGEGTSTGYSAPGMSVQYLPPAYEQVTTQCQYMPQQRVPFIISPQPLDTPEDASQQLENILAKNYKALADVDSDWIQSLLFGEA